MILEQPADGWLVSTALPPSHLLLSAALSPSLPLPGGIIGGLPGPSAVMLACCLLVQMESVVWAFDGLGRRSCLSRCRGLEDLAGGKGPGAGLQ